MNEVIYQILFFGMGLIVGWLTMLWMCVESAALGDDPEFEDEELEDELREEALNYAKKESRA